MKKAFLVISLIMSVVMLVLNSGDGIVNAAEGDVGYSVQAVIPENQIDKEKTYFDLQMKPGQQQTLEIIVQNGGAEEIDVAPVINYASTNKSGIIDYSQKSTEKRDKSLKTALPDIAKIKNGEEILTVPAKGSKKVEIEVTMPEKSYDGIILGAVQFKKVDKSNDESKNEGISIQNEYSYVVGVRLSETKQKVDPNLNLVSTKPGLVNYHTAVISKIQNDTAIPISNLDIEAEVFKGNSGSVLHKTEKKGLVMAPNSNFDFAIDWEDKPLETGNYRLKMTATNGEETWSWDENFAIKSESKSLTEQAVNQEETTSEWLYVGIAVAIVGLLSFMIVILKRRKKQD